MAYLLERIIVAGFQEIDEFCWSIGSIKFDLQVVKLESEMWVKQKECVQVDMKQTVMVLELWDYYLDLKHRIVDKT